ELIDGSLGMGYGVISNSLLLSLGLSPASASATVHTAEIFTTLASGVSHFKLGNVDKKLFMDLVVPGLFSAVIGAYLLVNFPSTIIRKLVSLYLILMGGVIILRAFKINIFFKKVNIKPLACVGGFLDAIGGGGWGPIVTSTLIANGQDPKKTIGSVNSAEFFITLVQSITFLLLMGFLNLWIVLALIIGGVIAAPTAAYICRKAPVRILLIVVGLLIIALNLRVVTI
ncbi:MAG: sulfite exporter TauE/SafE family protein, partial [Sulfolobales archaeon]